MGRRRPAWEQEAPSIFTKRRLKVTGLCCGAGTAGKQAAATVQAGGGQPGRRGGSGQGEGEGEGWGQRS